MRNKSCYIGLLICCALCAVVVADMNDDVAEPKKEPLQLTIWSTGQSLKDTKIKVMLKNVGTEKVTVLKVFDGSAGQIFFTVDMKDEKGARWRNGGGKISFTSDPLPYVTLEPGEFVGTTITLKDRFKDEIKESDDEAASRTLTRRDRLNEKEWAEGKYKLTVRYYNQYGEECFQGGLTSNTIDLPGANTEAAERGKEPLQCVIFQAGRSPGDTNVHVMLENVSEEKVTVLKEFRHIPPFFSLTVVNEAGTPRLSSAGKVSFRRGPLNYAPLEPGEFVGRTIAVKDVFTDIEDGKYKLTVEYHNQYGENCFQGWLTRSNAIDLVIGPQAESQPAAVTGNTELTNEAAK